MALGLSGYRLNGPHFLTGEPRREYHFQFSLLSNGIFNNSSAWAKLLFNPLFLLYISGLAEKVNLPSSKFTLAPVQLSTLQIQYPKGFETPTFSVQYIEDELESVAKFHKYWQDCIGGSDISGRKRGGLQFEELGKVCCKAIYAPSKRIPNPASQLANSNVVNKKAEDLAKIAGSISELPIEVPMGGEVFPYVFPVDIQRGSADRSGSNIVKTTVVYARVINTKYWNWSYFGGVKRRGGTESMNIKKDERKAVIPMFS